MTKKTTVPVHRGKTDIPSQPPLMNLRQEVNRLFDEFLSLNPFHKHFEPEPVEWWPWGDSGALHHADVVERDNAYQIDIEVPGMAEKDIEVLLNDDHLTVRGEMEEKKEEKKQDYFLSERRHGSFSRRFRLPDGIDVDKIEASLSRGVMTVTLPKKPASERKEKHIEVKAAE